MKGGDVEKRDTQASLRLLSFVSLDFDGAILKILQSYGKVVSCKNVVQD